MPLVTRQGKGAPLTHPEMDGNLTFLEALANAKAPSLHTHAWGDVTGKPTEFNPSVHTHTWLGITDKPATFPPDPHAHAYADITGKPATFPPDAHVAHDHISLTPQVDPGHGEGHIWYDSERHALSYKTDIPNTSMQVGFENWVRVRNTSGAMIPDGSAVVITGASGQNPTIALANATDHGPSRVLGLVTADIANNGQGYVTTFGELNGLNTSAWAEGTVLYLSATVPGALTETAPTHPKFVIALARVLYSHLTQGKILMTVRDAKMYDYEGAADDALAAHEAAGDPHGQYLTPAEANTAYSALGHGHAISDVAGLQGVLDGKATSGHNHEGVYAPAAHTHDYAALAHNHDASYASIENAYNLGNATGAVSLNAANGELQYATSTGATTWALSGAAAAPLVTSVTLELTNGGAFTQTWPSSATLKWDSGTAPTLTAAGVDILVFYSRDGGTTWRGFLAAKDSK